MFGKRSLLITCAILLGLTSAFGFRTSRKDSVGMTKINGKFFLRYMVSPGETIYRISSRFKVPVTDLIDLNPELENGLKTGQVINLPYNPEIAAKPVENSTVKYPAPTAPVSEEKHISTDSSAGGITYHRVEPGESFFSLSRKYGISVNDLLKMNNVELKTGQKIIVAKAPDAKLPEQEKAEETVHKPGEVKEINPAPKPVLENTNSENPAQETETAEEYHNGTKRLLVIPFDPYLYFSDADDEIAAVSRMTRTKVRQAFRRRLSALLEPKGYETIHLLGGQARDSITDLNRIYSSVSYGYQNILHNPDNMHDVFQAEDGAVKAEKSKKQKQQQKTDAGTSRASQASDPGKYFGVKIGNPAFLTYFNNRYHIDYYLFITQFEVKTNYENCLDRAALNYERGFITHFTVFDRSGKIIAGNRIYTEYNSNANNIEKILADNMQKVANKIMAELPRP